MSRMNKSDLLAWCEANKVDVPLSATIAQLRELYTELTKPDGINSENSVVPELSTTSEQDERTENSEISGHSEQQGVQPNILIPSNITQLDDEEACVEKEIRLLEKRKKLLTLRNELRLLEEASSSNNGNISQPSFKDIKYSISEYSGDDSYDAKMWLDAFERTCESVHGDSTFRLKCIRRLMKQGSAAELFVRIDNSKTYEEFRATFLTNFGHNYSISDVIDKMRKTTFNSSKSSIMGYILKMQELASRANIDERQTIQFIIDGFRDRSNNIAVLYPACNLDELKQLSHRYSQLRNMNSNPVIFELL